MRMIDADALLKVIEEKACEPQYMHNGEDWEVGLVIAETLVQYAPTVDAVPVIRCKDCKYRDEQSANCTRFRKDWYVQSNSFCSWAERKENGNKLLCSKEQTDNR